MTGPEHEIIGSRQHEVLTRARSSAVHLVIPRGWLERRACRRLVARGLLHRLSLDTNHLSDTKQITLSMFRPLPVYRLTKRAKEITNYVVVGR